MDDELKIIKLPEPTWCVIIGSDPEVRFNFGGTYPNWFVRKMYKLLLNWEVTKL